MTVYFTSDQHYHHVRIIDYSKRPFKDVEAMNEGLIDNYNSVVKDGDLVYHLGDFGFGRGNEVENVLRRLKGQKYLIFGNHDKDLRSKKELLDRYFIWARDYAEIEVEKQKIILCHYSFRVWRGSHRGAWNLYGHSHGSLYDDPNMLSLDVGVDPQNYFPISFEQVKALMSKKTWKPIDHHGVSREE
jgi:calcineurin-like phosphoesterase family protein